jgi:hypothetical protein
MKIKVGKFEFEIFEDLHRCNSNLDPKECIRVSFSKKQLEKLDEVMNNYKTNVVMYDTGYYHITLNQDKWVLAPAY